MTIDILELHDPYYEAAAVFVNMLDPTRSPQAEEWRQADLASVSSGLPYHRWVAVDSPTQVIIGYSHFWPVQFPQFRMDLFVHPAWRRQGIGQTLLARLLDGLHSRNAATIQARTGEDAVEALTFLQRRQFREIHRMVELQLDLTQIDVAAFAEPIKCLSEQGIQVVTLASEQAAESACWQKLTALHNAALPGWPQPDPGQIEHLTPVAMQQLLAAWNVISEGFFLAKRNHEYLGYSGLARHPTNAQVIESGGTAVHPKHAGQGLATILKMCALSYARQHGYTIAATRSANPAMIRVNEKVGFQRGLSEVRLVRVLGRRQSPAS